MTVRYVVGDTRDVVSTIPDASVDLVVTSPPFLALRSYLPDDHPDKAKELGSEPNPAAFIDMLLALTAEWRRVLAPHGTLAVELGDTYSGSGPGGISDTWGDTNPKRRRVQDAQTSVPPKGDGWPLAKSQALIPELYRVALAYGRNPLTGTESPAGRWRVRNNVTWCLDIDTPAYVRTPTGDRPMRLLHLHQQFQPGRFQLWDGERWTPVLGTSQTTTTDDGIELRFRNGEKVACTREHQWPVDRDGIRKVVRADELTVGDIIPTVTLPDNDGREPRGLPDDDIGWLVGVFMGDGSFDSRDRIQISGHRVNDRARGERLARIAADYDGTCSTYEHGTGFQGNVVVRSRALAEVLRKYVGGDGARNKHLNPAAWCRSNRFLAAIMDGYLESDGYYDELNDRWRLGFTDNPWLARDLRTIAARLGWSLRMRRRARPADIRGGSWAGSAPFAWYGWLTKDPTRRFRPDGELVAISTTKRRSFIDVGVEGEPHLFALASGLLTHNCRPNPPVGALGDKFRPSTSDLVIACTSDKRWFDLDAVRGDYSPRADKMSMDRVDTRDAARAAVGLSSGNLPKDNNPAGAPPLDHWVIPPGGYKGAHYATWPAELLEKPVEACCPRRVCRTCGTPSRRITSDPEYVNSRTGKPTTTLHFRDGEHIDLDSRNADLARERLGMFLEVEHHNPEAAA